MTNLHVPAWAWAVTIAAVVLLVAADLLVSSRRNRAVRLSEAAWWTLATVALAVGFGALLAISSGGTAAGQFFAGWLTEYSLSLDNLLVFIILISRARVPRHLQGRVVLAGIMVALLLRGVFIALGAAALHKFEWVEYLFGGFLIYTAAEIAARRRLDIDESPQPVTGPQADPAGNATAGPQDRATRLLSRLTRGRPGAPVLMLVIALGVTDLLFAFDSIPAIFGLTRDPYLVFSANVFALLGLRHLYFLAGGLLSRLVYLPAGLAVVLAFIGVKLIGQALRASGVTRLGSVPVPGVGAWQSLLVIAGVLGLTAAASVAVTRRGGGRPQPAGSPPTGSPPASSPPTGSHPASGSHPGASGHPAAGTDPR
jgi:tellurite resistance protein TerC